MIGDKGMVPNFVIQYERLVAPPVDVAMISECLRQSIRGVPGYLGLPDVQGRQSPQSAEVHEPGVGDRGRMQVDYFQPG